MDGIGGEAAEGGKAYVSVEYGVVRLGASANGEDASIVGGHEDCWGAKYVIDFI